MAGQMLFYLLGSMAISLMHSATMTFIIAAPPAEANESRM